MTPDQRAKLGSYIAERRAAVGMSQRKLAEAIGVQNSTILRLENGEIAAPGPDHLAAIASVLDIDLADIYALAEYAVPKRLPSLKPYLRTRYDLPDDATEQIEQYAQRLAKRHGVDLSGPAPGEDEEPPRSMKPTKKGGRT